jgi:ribosomal protein L40E/DNA-directed RNA polymerase subunit RPC12/RpoP
VPVPPRHQFSRKLPLHLRLSAFICGSQELSGLMRYTTNGRRITIPAMYELAGMEYECPACGRKREWRPESSGRPVICDCGAGLLIPFRPGMAERGEPVKEFAPSNEPLQEPEEIEVDEAKAEAEEIALCPDCGASMRSGAIVCTQCGYHRARPKNHIIRRPSDRDDESSPDLRPIRDRWLPASLTVLGVVIEVALLAHIYDPPLRFANAIALTPLLILVAAGTVVVGLLIGLLLAPVLDLILGSVGELAVKMSAAVVFPAAAGTLIYFLSGRGITGVSAGWLASVILYLALFRLLFEFEWPDAMLLVALVCLAHAVILFVVVWPLTELPEPMLELWRLYKPIVAESVLTFVIAGTFVLPHFKEPKQWP